MKLFIGMLVFCFGSMAWACSDLLLKNSGENVISGRTMDFEYDLGSHFVKVPKGTPIFGEVVTKYDFIGIDLKGKPLFSDGMNEAGLSLGALWNYGTTYQDTKKEDPTKKRIPMPYFPSWVLGTFKSIEELRPALERIVLIPVYIEEIKTVPPLHVVFHDRMGKSLIMEFEKGKMKLIDSPSGILTNSPNYDKQQLAWKKFENIGNASKRGEMGSDRLPGGTGSTARFIMLNFLNKHMTPSLTLDEAIARTFGALGRVSVLPGEKINESGMNHTLWTVVRDHKNLIYYYTTATRSQVRSVSLKELPAGEKSSIPLN